MKKVSHEKRGTVKALCSRRGFMKTAALGAFWIPASRIYGQALPKLKDQVRFAAIGAGGIGYGTTYNLCTGGGTVVALCDTDHGGSLFERSRKMHPGIPVFHDYREMFDRMGKDFDAVAISTPDHTHAYIAIESMLRGYHVYLQKPLARTFEECELIGSVAKRTGRILQMGNQGHPGCARYRGMRDSGLWGDILSVDSWTAKSGSRRKFEKLTGSRTALAYPKPMPFDGRYNKATWDLWCGPAADHGYSDLFAPTLWRLWWDYGTSSIGDMGVHNMDPMISEFELGMPYSVTARCAAPVTIGHADDTTIVMKFKPNKWLPKGVTITWRDGLNAYPPKVEGSHPKFEYAKNGLLVHGSRYTTFGDSHAAPPIVIAETGKPWGAGVKAVQREWLQKVKKVPFDHIAHYREFIDAVRAGDPGMCGSRPEVAVPLTETLLLGLIATRYPGTELKFDAASKRITDNPGANELFKAPSRGVWDVRKLAGSDGGLSSKAGA